MQKKKTIISFLKTVAFSFVFALEIITIFFFKIHIPKIDKEIVLLGVIFIFAFILAFSLQIFFSKFLKNRFYLRLLLSFAIPGFILLSSFFIYSIYKIDIAIQSKNSSELVVLDDGKESAFSNHKVLILVPHQDDEIAICGGIIEQFKKYQSEIYVVFASSGDIANYYYPEIEYGTEMGEIRCKEALQVLNDYGIPENHIYFMGYGNYWKNVSNMYNQPENKKLISYSGLTKTYALPYHPAYNNGKEYTRANYKEDLTCIINDIKPDTIFCIDCDKNLDHKELSLLFEEVMGTILQNPNNNYTPNIFKGFAYNLSLYSKNDYFYNENNNQTLNPYKTDYLKENHAYLWENRIRFPVSVLSQTICPKNSTTVQATIKYHTQFINTIDAECSSNSDKVFWKRNTESILYTSDIQVSSGNASCLNDFKLVDTDDINQEDCFVNGSGIWIPDKTDKSQSILINLSNPSDIFSIVLYDNVSVNDNILNAEIKLDNGKIINSGPLSFNGSGTEIIINEKNIKKFEIKILDSEGNKAGISEIEAYSQKQNDGKIDFIKIIDQNNNFIYNYYTHNEKNVFLLYEYGNVEKLSPKAYSVSVDNNLCSAEISNNGIEVFCPKNQVCTVTLESNDKKVSDVIRINNGSAPLLGRKIQIIYREQYTFSQQKEYLKLVGTGVLEIVHHFFN